MAGPHHEAASRVTLTVIGTDGAPFYRGKSPTGAASGMVPVDGFLVDLGVSSPQLDRQRVLRRTRRVRLALTRSEVHYGLGELVGIAGHSGALWHGPSVGLAA